MNVEQVEALGKYLRGQASRDVATAQQQIDHRITGLHWAGPEADRFRQEVWPVRRDQLRSISEELSGFGERVLADARQQREASSAGVGSGPSGSSLVCKVPEGSDSAVLADRMRDGEPGPQDLMIARIVAGQTPPGWEELSDDRLRAAGLDPSLFSSNDGFSAHLYRNEAGDVVLVFDGTDPTSGRDWGNNVNQFRGARSSQYEQAVALARSVNGVYGKDLVIAGHSLGGGLASAAAVATDSPGVTFNPAAVHDNTLREAGLEPSSARASASGLVRSYRVEGEILHDAQAVPSMASGPDVLGADHELDNGENEFFYQVSRVGDAVSPWRWPIAAAKGVERHLMGSVLDAMERDSRFDGSDWGN